MTKSLEDHVADSMAKEMQKKIDFEVLCELLEKMGWRKVSLERFKDNNHANDIIYWCRENLKSQWQRNGSHFIFEDDKEAMMFTLKWK